jgi:hypothetical protein
LNEGVKGGIEAKVRETLELETVVEKSADDPRPIRGVDLKMVSFEE